MVINKGEETVINKGEEEVAVQVDQSRMRFQHEDMRRLKVF